MALCWSRCFLLRELFILPGDDFEEGISSGGANNGDALGWQFVVDEKLCGVCSVGPAGAEDVSACAGVWPDWTAAYSKPGRDGEGDGCNT